jgi:hypothetical protein
MKLLLNISLLFFSTFFLVDKSLSLTDYQIRKFCRKEQMKSTCIKNLQEKKSHLKEGKHIEIPVIPYKR